MNDNKFRKIFPNLMDKLMTFPCMLIALSLLVLMTMLNVARAQENHNGTSSEVKNNNPAATIEAQLDFLRTGDVSKAYYAYTSQSFRSATTFDAFKQFIRDNATLARNKSSSFQSPLFYEKKMAVIKGTLVSREGKSNDVKFDLIWEDGAWKVMGIQIYSPSH